MKNLLNINSRNKVLRDVFKTFEQEAINSLISLTKDSTKAIVMPEKLFKRFAKLNNGIKASRRIYTYRQSILEIQDSDHPFEVRFKGAIISKTIDLHVRGKIEATSQTILMFDVSAYMSKEYTAFKKVIETGYQVTSLEDLFTLHGSNHFTNTLDLLKKNNIEVDIDFITSIYFEQLNERPTMKADSLANDYVEEYYMDKLNTLSFAIFSFINRSHNLKYLLSVFIDLSKIDNNQFLNFVGGEYTRIPYFGITLTPFTAVIIKTEMDDLKYEYELFIKGEGQVVHIIYTDNDNLIQYNSYDTSKREKLKINGNEFCIDNDFLEGQHLDLLLMVLSDYREVTVHTNIKYDYQATIEWASTYISIGEPDYYKNGILHEYLEQRGE